ncbi:MAG: dolichyl-phosphate-mannose--protein mannosyltransferase [Thermodesulfobacteriota bacterium]
MLLFAQTMPALGERSLWFSDEVRYAAAFKNVLNGHWLVLHLNDAMYPDKPPVYFWLLWIISLFTGGALPETFFAGAMISAMLYLHAVCRLARCAAEASADSVLLSGFILLSTFYFAGLAQYSRMDLLFAALILESQTCFYLGTREDNPNAQVIVGFLLSALATLTKGPLGLAFPALAIGLFLAWRGRLRRMLGLDFHAGGLLLLSILGAWALGAYLTEGPAYLDNIFDKQIYQRALRSWHHDQPWWHYFATLPLVWLPYTLLLAFAPWKRILRIQYLNEMRSIRQAPNGKAFLWVALVSQFALLSSIQTKIVIYALPLFAPAAILAALALGSLPPASSRRFFGIAAGVMIIPALAVPAFAVFSPWPVPIRGAWLVSACLALTAMTAWLLRGEGPRIVVLALALGVTLTLLPLGRLTLPSLDAVMSPKAQALAMKDYVTRGYAPAAFDIYAGIYEYYAGSAYMESDDEKKLEQFLASNSKAVVAFKKKIFVKMQDRLPRMRVVHEQWIVDQPYVLAIKD